MFLTIRWLQIFVSVTVHEDVLMPILRFGN